VGAASDAGVAGDDAGDSGVLDSGSNADGLESDSDGLWDGSADGPSDRNEGPHADVATTDGGGPLANVLAIAAGGHDTCALLVGGSVLCWGDNGRPDSVGGIGQLGTTAGPQYCHPGVTGWCSTKPMAVPNLAGAATVSAGYGETCALLPDGTVICTGGGSQGLNLNSVRAVGVDSAHSCAVLTDGSVECWDYASGQLSAQPVAVANLTGAVAVSAGGRHTCALLADGTVKCWGDNSTGQLGDSTMTASMSPVVVGGLMGVRAISASIDDRTCAVLSDGTVWCWGSNTLGGLGNGNYAGPQLCRGNSCSTTPLPVSNLTGATAITTGNAGNACVLLSDGTVECWGNIASQLRAGSDAGQQVCADDAGQPCSTPVHVVDLTGVTAIAGGWLHACALLAGGTVKCWGDNSMGQLGNGMGGQFALGTMTYSAMPVVVSSP
jgi:alpha-tubulin suppressor-like RCC1 family protein